MNQLDRIIEHKKNKAKKKPPLQNRQKRKVLNFRDAITGHSRPRVIAEFKRTSPSQTKRHDVRLEEQIGYYERNGASALSILTDECYFGGHIGDIIKASEVSALPILCKDFIVSKHQIDHAYQAGADAVLLIMKVLGDKTAEFIEHAQITGMQALIETQSHKEIEQACDSGASIIGINNRNLCDMSINLRNSCTLSSAVPDHIACISESGIKNKTDYDYVSQYPFDAVLIGHALMQNRELLNEVTGNEKVY